MIHVLIADDHTIVREGLKLILSQFSDMQVEDAPIKGLEPWRLVQARNWNVLLLDVMMPGNGGLDLLRRLKRLCSTLRVLVFSVHPEEQCGVQVLKAGADGYVNTSSSPGELVKAVRKVAAGGKYISPLLAELLAQRLHTDEDQPAQHILSAREYEVFLNLAAGETPTSIAQSLGLSIKTVSTYRTRVLEKLHLRTNSQLVHYAIQRDLVLGFSAYEQPLNNAFLEKVAAS